ncbi:helix-turn-helix transcriptional regulator [Polaribacter sp. R77954]|uniref:helix-turn-helix transcriptional regulator n=1 Tax=Polaribacter sp. R77954 TaxID=3093870 RepID=UPI0037C54427
MNFSINTDTWFIFCLLFIGILSLFIFLYIIIPYNTRKRNTKRRQNRLSRKLNNFERLKNKHRIKNLEKSNIKLQATLKKDLSTIIHSNYNETDIETFFLNFEKLYPNFKKSLFKIAPNLTANELKLAAFLRLNLSSKEISKLLNITPESVHKARYRLRKKLNLSTKEDLSTFIINL